MLAYSGLGYTLVLESCTVREKNYVPHYFLEPEEKISWPIGVVSLTKNPLSHAAYQLQLLIPGNCWEINKTKNEKADMLKIVKKDGIFFA